MGASNQEQKAQNGNGRLKGGRNSHGKVNQKPNCRIVVKWKKRVARGGGKTYQVGITVAGISKNVAVGHPISRWTDDLESGKESEMEHSFKTGFRERCFLSTLGPRPHGRALKTKGVFIALMLCVLSFSCGCARKSYIKGNGDSGQFILQRAIALGGRPVLTNGLPGVPGDWEYIQDNGGIVVMLPMSSFAATDIFLRSAFGPPSNKIGWTLRDIGVAILLQRVGTNTQVGVLKGMSEEKLGRMLKETGETIEKNVELQKKR
jgi:hypothetical protein